MTDSSTHPADRALPGAIPPIEAAPGWQVVCAVKYSTLNKALLAGARPTPQWRRGGPVDLQGSSTAGRLAQGLIDAMQLAPGCGGLLRWRIEVNAAQYHNLSSRLRIDGAFRFSVLIRTQLCFAAAPGQPGLLRVQVDPDASLPAHMPQVTSVTLDPEFLADTRLNIFDVANIEADLKAIVARTLPAHLPEMLGAMPLSGPLSPPALRSELSRSSPQAYTYGAGQIGAQHEELLVVLVPADESVDFHGYAARDSAPLLRQARAAGEPYRDDAPSMFEDSDELAAEASRVPLGLWLSGYSLAVNTLTP